MGITGWIDNARDLRREQPVLRALAAALGPTSGTDGLARAGRRAAFARRGAGTGYADWRHPERPDPDLVLLHDGHLTNRDQLEDQLYQRPQPLTSDAEILLHAYRRWGASLVDRLEGAFTIAIWDERARELLLIRDPLGARTLYYLFRPDGILFASQATALLAHPDIKRSVDAEGLNELLTLGPVRTPGHGVIEGVQELLPGGLLRATPTGLLLGGYRRLTTTENGADLPGAIKAVTRELSAKTASLRRRPAGAVLLSGGMASIAAAIYTTSTRAGDRPTAYSLTMDPPGALSRDTKTGYLPAAYMTRLLRLKYKMVTADDHALHSAAAIARRATDFPGPANLDATLLGLLRHTAAERHTSVVTGHGATAAFGGYRWLLSRADLAHDDFPWRLRGLAPVDLLNDDTLSYLQPDAYRKMRFHEAAVDLPAPNGEASMARRRRAMWHLTLTNYLPHQLVRLDQLASAAGITVHTPFTDWDLVQYLSSLPFDARHPMGVPNGLLRATVIGVLPAPMTMMPNRPLIGAHLLPDWATTQRDQLLGIVADPAAPLHPLLDRERVRQLLKQSPTEASRDWHTTIAYLNEVNAWLSRHRMTPA